VLQINPQNGGPPQYVVVQYEEERRRREQPADLNARAQPFTLNIVPINNGQLNQTYSVVATAGS